jgi:Gram-negative bacterial TonB protein C-terminal
MRAKWMRIIAVASVFLASGFLLSQPKPGTILAAGAQGSAQSPAPNPRLAQPNETQETPPAPTRDQNAARNGYKPATVVSAADVPFPFETSADGVVVFGVSLGSAGAISKIDVLQDVPPFTSATKQSLRNWKFAPASENGKAEGSEMPVAFVFRHAVYIAKEPPFTPLLAAKDSDGTPRGFVPPGILSISYAAYPANTIAMGAVVVQAEVRPDGSTGKVRVVRDLEGGFAPLAIDAAKHWKFQPASRNGRPLPSNVAIAFVFSSRALNPF